MRILYLTTWCPFPTNNGSKIRTAYLLQSIARKHEVTLLTFSEEGLSTEDIAAMAPPLAGIYSVQDNAFHYNNLPAPIKYISPMPMAFWKNPTMAKRLTDIAAHTPFDIIVAMSVPVARYPFQLKNTPRLLDLEQSHTLVLEERYRAAQSSLAKQRYRLGWRKSAIYEAQFIRNYDACTLVSQKEVDYYTQMIGAASTRLTVIPNGVDLAKMRPGMAPKEDAALIFNGALTYSVNYDAMQYFLSEVYPRIRQRIPGVSLVITGSTQGVDLSGLKLDDSVHFSGYVPDIRPLVAGAAVCVAPLRQGAGTRLKILEAMALGTPVVSTGKGLEGLNVIPEQHVLLADDPQAFADQTVRLLEDPNLRTSLVESALKLVGTSYDWAEIGDRFCRLIEDVVLGHQARFGQ